MRNLASSAGFGIYMSIMFGAVGSIHAGEIEILFRMCSPDLSEDAEVYIAGSVSGLGNWKPDAKRMTYAGGHVWTFQLVLSKEQTIEYKYTLGSWTIEGADATGKPLQNLTLSVMKSTTIRNCVEFWTKQRTREIRGQITGAVKYHRQLSAGSIRERDVIVWLPPDYETSSDRYPVLYMHDGQNIIDPKTSAFGVDWQIDETCTSLIEKQVIAPLIIVGIYNTPDRSEEYLPGPKCTAYMNFVASTLKPLIDEEYRTKPSREHTFVGGSSAGGLCAFMLTWEHSQVFSKALCMSPAFKFENVEKGVSVDYVATVEKTDRPTTKVVFYIDNGGVGQEENLQPGIHDMLEALRNKGFETGKDLWWFRAIDARHSESAWAKRFPDAIGILDGRR